MNTDNTEVWKQIPGHPGYEASSLGRIRSIDRAETYFRKDCKNPINRSFKGKILKQYLENNGYLTVFLGRGTIFRSHRLVYEAFYGKIPKGKVINHKDCIKTNNNIKNLEDITTAENISHAWNSGVYRACLSKKPPLTEAEIHAIRFFYPKTKDGYGYGVAKILAKVFNRSKKTMYMIANQKQKHGPVTKESISAVLNRSL